MSMCGLRRKRRNREGTVRLNYVVKLIDDLRGDLVKSNEQMNQHISECKQLINNVHLDLTNFKGEMNHHELVKPSGTYQEDMQKQINSMDAERHSGSLEKNSDKDGIFVYNYGWRRYFGMILWNLAIVGLIVGCAWNLREILQDMMESSTVTKMTYTFHDKLPLPPITVYHYGHYKSLYTQTIHTEKLFKALENGSLTEAYLEAIIKGVGIGLFEVQNITVQPSEITEAYKQAILRYGSLTEAGSAFYREYGVACNEMFTYCGGYVSPALNCCDIFEFSWGLNGPQYSLKWNTIFLDAFRGFRIYLRSFPNIEVLQRGNLVEEPGNYQPYWIVINNGVDQTGTDIHSIEVQHSEEVNILLSQKRRNLKVSKDCVDIPPKLRYFRDYTINNCFFERSYLDKLSLCNISCEIPLLQLLNPNNLRGPPCEYDVVNSTCWDFINAKYAQPSAHHGCRFPCNHTEVEYVVTRGLKFDEPGDIFLYFKFASTEVQTFEETSRLTQWEYLSLISGILDLWLGITIYSLHRMLHRGLSRIAHFKTYDLGKKDSDAVYFVNAKQSPKMVNLSNTERTSKDQK